eukprot:jgi/Ulvmu1/3457/UM016_0077.1
MVALRSPTLLDLDDDVLCRILRTAYGVSGDDLPVLQLGVGATSDLSLLSAAQTCHRLRYIVLHTLPTIVMARLQPVMRPSLPSGFLNRLGRGKEKSDVEPRPQDFTSAKIVDIGIPQKPYGCLQWATAEKSLESRCLYAVAVTIDLQTFKALSKFQDLLSLDVVGCKFGSGPGALACMSQMKTLRQLSFTIHTGVPQSALSLLAELTGLQVLGLIAENSPIINVRTMADTFRRLHRLESLTIDSSRGLAEASLTALPYLTRLTSLDIMRSNPNLGLFPRQSLYAAPPPRSGPVRLNYQPLPPATLQRRSMVARTSLDCGSTDPRAPLFTPDSLSLQRHTTPAGDAATDAASTPPPPTSHHLPGTTEEPLQLPAEHAITASPPLPSLLQLRLSHLINSSVDTILHFLTRFPSLRALELLYCEQVTSAALAPIVRLSSLERLRLHACARIVTLPTRAGLPALKEVDLALCTHVQNDALEALAGVQEDAQGPQLLRLDGCKRLTAAAIAERMHVGSVRALSLAFCTGMREEELIALAPSLKALEEVSLEGCVHLKGEGATTFASSLPQLRVLDLTSIKVRDRDVERLHALTDLRALRMRPQVTSGAIERAMANSIAPVWRAMIECTQQQKWVASVGHTGWRAFLSKGWKIPQLAV